jgi:hypothetical protein
MIIAIGFENTILDKNNSIYKDAVNTINKLYEKHKILIWTEKYDNKDITFVKNFLSDNKINYHSLNKNIDSNISHKIVADLFIDNKMIKFENNWSQLKNIFGKFKTISIDIDTIFNINELNEVVSMKDDVVKSFDFLYNEGQTLILTTDNVLILTIKNVKKALKDNNIKYTYFNNTISKENVDYYISTKCITFNNNWDEIKKLSL